MVTQKLKIHTLKYSKLISVMSQFKKDPLATLSELQQEYGDLIYCPWPINTLIVLDPLVLKELFSEKTSIVKGSQADKLKPLVGNGLFSAEGASWKRQRRQLAPLFHNKYIDMHAKKVKEMTIKHIKDWQGLENINLTKEMTELTFSISGQILFGGIPKVNIAEVRKSVEIAGEVIFQKIGAIFPSPYWIPSRKNRRFLKARKTLDLIADDLIKKARKNQSSENHDLLSMMLKAGISDDRELRDQIKTMMIAGHDTTTTFILWTIIYLLHDKELLQEIKENLLKDESFVESQTFRNLLNESLRLCPPSPIISRMNTKEITLGNNKIKAGTNIIASQYILGRDQRIWNESTTFLAKRFESIDLQNDKYKYSFFPFSLGARRCVGENMAYLEASIIIAEMIKNLDLTPVMQSDYSKESICDLSLRPKHNFFCNAQ